MQQKLGKMVGNAPGADMKTALELAREQKLQIALIDQPLPITLRNFSKSITWKEKGRFVADIIKGLLFPRRQMCEMGLDTLDLRKVPEKELIKNLLDLAKKNYPNLYHVLVTDRNKFMARKLITLMQEHSVLAVVGAGHEKGLIEEIKKLEKSEFVANHAALL